MNRFWTPGEDDVIRMAHKQKMTARDIARQFFPGKSPCAVRHRSIALGITLTKERETERFWGEEEDIILEEAFEAGMNDTEIASLLLPEFSSNTIRAKRRVLGLLHDDPRAAFGLDAHQASKASLERRSEVLLSALGTHHPHGCGERKIPQLADA